MQACGVLISLATRYPTTAPFVLEWIGLMTVNFPIRSFVRHRRMVEFPFVVVEH